MIYLILGVMFLGFILLVFGLCQCAALGDCMIRRIKEEEGAE